MFSAHVTKIVCLWTILGVQSFLGDVCRLRKECVVHMFESPPNASSLRDRLPVGPVRPCPPPRLRRGQAIRLVHSNVTREQRYHLYAFHVSMLSKAALCNYVRKSISK